MKQFLHDLKHENTIFKIVFSGKIKLSTIFVNLKRMKKILNLKFYNPKNKNKFAFIYMAETCKFFKHKLCQA